MNADREFQQAQRPARVAVVLVNWNGWRDAIECISSLLGQDYPSFHVFLVDNDSRDGSIENIQQWCETPRMEASWRAHDGVTHLRATAGSIAVRVIDRPANALPAAPEGGRVTLIRSGGNLGFAGGCNVGMVAAGADSFDFFWLLNTDTVVHRDALGALIRRARGGSAIGMVGSTLRYYDRPEIVQAMGGAFLEPDTVTSRHIGEGVRLDAGQIDAMEVERKMFYVMGASMLVSSAYVRAVGLMQEDYFLYYEEIDWAVRGRQRFQLGYAADSHIFHKSGASSSKVMPAFSAGFYYRNRIRFVRRFFPDRLAVQRRILLSALVRHTLRGRWVLARVVARTLWEFRKIAAQVPHYAPTDTPAAAPRSMARK
jgi:hypothetical protein